MILPYKKYFLNIISKIKKRGLINSWKSKYGYISEKKIIDTGFDVVETEGLMIVPIDILRANIWTTKGLISLPISSAPHYVWIRDVIHGKLGKSEVEYRNYIAKYYKDEHVNDSIIETKKMIKSILDKNDIEKIEIVVFPPIEKNGNMEITIFDGNHRTALRKVKGYDHIKVRILKCL